MKVLLAIGAACALALPGAARAATSEVVLLRLDGSIQPASLRYLERGLEAAQERRAALVLLELDTPGGTLVSLRKMTTAILESEVPVAVYVTPGGAQAASAGFFLLLAADVAAMAPGTNAGAAAPVAMGQSPPGDREGPQGAAMAKATEDAAALVRSLAEGRGRPVDWAERAVREARSYSAEEARRYGLVDHLASNRAQLLQALDGRSLRRFDGRAQALALAGAEVRPLEPTLAERLLMVIASPELAYLLLMLGFLGLMVELTHPGAVVPGVVGVLCLLLGLYAFSVLPVNWAGALLIVAGLALLAAEAFVASYGLLALAGLLSLVLGSAILVDSPLPGVRLGLELIIPSAVVLAGVILLLASRVARSRRTPVRSGPEAMVGEIGEVVAEGSATHEGKVYVHGEYWAATAPGPLVPGARVRVFAVDGQRLLVGPV